MRFEKLGRRLRDRGATVLAAAVGGIGALARRAARRKPRAARRFAASAASAASASRLRHGRGARIAAPRPRVAEEVYAKQPEREALFTTDLRAAGRAALHGGGPRRVPTPSATSGYPGEYPFTRGVYPSMYRGRLWTMRQFAGFGTAEETNERFRYLLDHGQTGLSTAFDMPTLMGYDSDHARSLGEVGLEGVAIDTLDDMDRRCSPGSRSAGSRPR